MVKLVITTSMQLFTRTLTLLAEKRKWKDEVINHVHCLARRRRSTQQNLTIRVAFVSAKILIRSSRFTFFCRFSALFFAATTKLSIFAWTKNWISRISTRDQSELICMFVSITNAKFVSTMCTFAICKTKSHSIQSVFVLVLLDVYFRFHSENQNSIATVTSDNKAPSTERGQRKSARTEWTDSTKWISIDLRDHILRAKWKENPLRFDCEKWNCSNCGSDDYTHEDRRTHTRLAFTVFAFRENRDNSCRESKQFKRIFRSFECRPNVCAYAISTQR